MKKAILQDNHIQYDLLKCYNLRNLAIGIAGVLACGGMGLLIAMGFFSMGSMAEETVWKWIVYTAIVAAMAGLIGSFSWRIMSKRRCAKQRNFTVLRDRLITTTEEADRIGMDYEYVNMKFLRFSSFGEYRIPHIMHYTWSKEYCMSPNGICNAVLDGEEFYIVTADHRTVLMVYPTKFFEYRAEPQNPFELT